MPELPELLYIVHELEREVAGHTVQTATVFQPVVLRCLFPGTWSDVLPQRRLQAVRQHGPFIVLVFDQSLSVIVNLMLAGRLDLEPGLPPRRAAHCLLVEWNDGRCLVWSDPKKMMKVCLAREDQEALIPGYATQGVSVLSPEFTLDRFRSMLQGQRTQVRVLLRDHTRLSAIGNAYADEILFAAHLHPKTFCHTLTDDEVATLHRAIREVLHEAIQRVAEHGGRISEKDREHLKVRNRHGEPYPVCGTTIRREGVRGHDTFFCPRCQPVRRKVFIDWNREDRGQGIGNREQ